MGVAAETKDLYAFDVRADILFFKVGSHQLVSFHSPTYHIKRRMSAREVQALVEEAGFIAVNSGCYVNPYKISAIRDDLLYFGEERDAPKTLPVSRRKQQLLKSIAGI